MNNTLPTARHYAAVEQYIEGLPDDEAERLLDEQIARLFSMGTNLHGYRSKPRTVEGTKYALYVRRFRERNPGYHAAKMREYRARGKR